MPRGPGERPEIFSVSQVTTYLSCPRKYRFRYLDRREPEHRSADLALGSAVHSAIEWYQVERIAGVEPELSSVLRIFRCDWHSQGALGDLTFDEDEKPEDLNQLGRELVRLFVERFRDEPPPSAVEERFEVFVRHPKTGALLPVPLVGYFDLVGPGYVGEMKTTARRSPVSAWSLQLSAYSHAQRRLTGERPTMRVIQLVKTKVPKVEVEELVVSEQEENWFVEVAVEVYAAITAGAFPPSPSWMCGRCEYRRACGRPGASPS